MKIPKGNQNPHIEEEQTTQWPKEKIQKDKQRSTKHTNKTKDRITRTPLISLLLTGADPGFQVRGGGGHLKILRRAEGGVNIFEVFRVKNHDFTPKNHIFSNFRVRPPPGSAPAYHTNASSCSLLARHRYFNKNCCGLN